MAHVALPEGLMSLAYRTLLSDFGHLTGLDPGQLLETQALSFDDEPITLTFVGTEEAGEILLVTSLGTPSPEAATGVYRRLLEANHLGNETAGMNLGLQAASGLVTLCGRIPLAQLSAQDLHSSIEIVSAVAAHWRLFVQSPASEGDAPVSAPVHSSFA